MAPRRSPRRQPPHNRSLQLAPALLAGAGLWVGAVSGADGRIGLDPADGVRSTKTLEASRSGPADRVAEQTPPESWLGEWTCAPQGRTCTFGSDCCSNNCVSDPKLGKICKPEGASWTCAPEGRGCTFGSDCCSKNCVSDPKLGKICKPEGASWTCVPEGQSCSFGSDCCSANCVSDPKLGKVCKPKS